jgi:hypothetical protein
LFSGFKTLIFKAQNEVYAFILRGDVTINIQALKQPDGIGIWGVDRLSIKADSHAEFLRMK